MSLSSKVRIAVTGPIKSGLTAWLFTALNVYLAGGTPVRVTPDSFNGSIDFDGVIIGGGSDIHPENFKQQETPKVERPLSIKIKELVLYPMELINRLSSGCSYDKQRDEMEKHFIEYAFEYDKPIL